jgi:hypothetical protein
MDTIQYSTFNIQRRMLGELRIQHPLDVGSWMLGVGCFRFFNWRSVLLIGLALLPQLLWGQNNAILRVAVVSEQGGPSTVSDLLTVEPSTPMPQCVFGGQVSDVKVKIRNPGSRFIETECELRLHQASSAITAKWNVVPWRKIRVLPGQTVLETAPISFPAVKAATLFVIQWVVKTNLVLGHTEIWVYPSNLLKELEAITSRQPIGVFDPQDQIKSLLKRMELDFADLEAVSIEGFSGKLAIFGPFASKQQMREGLPKQIELLATKGTTVVWIQPPQSDTDEVQPSFYAVRAGKGEIVIVQSSLVSDLSKNPQAQLALLQCARQTLRPQPPRLPFLTRSP